MEIIKKQNNDYKDPNSSHNLIQIACESKTYETVAALLTAPDIKINAYQEGTSPALLIAVKRGDENIINLLVDHQNSHIIKSCDYNGDTLLHYACRNCICYLGNGFFTQFLLEKGADPTKRNIQNRTPLAVAFFENPNFDPSCFQNLYDTHYKSFHFEKLQDLIYKKTNIHGNTQLHLAASLTYDGVDAFSAIYCEKFDQYITFLLNNGLSLYSRNNNNKRPVDIAYERYIRVYKKCLKYKESTYNLIRTESVWHSFLRFHALTVQYASFTHILQEYLQDNFGQIIQELQTHIARLYYILNIETVIAHRYKYDVDYYRNFDNKEIAETYFLTHPKPKLLWNGK
jgi:ankyrin repeat protein